MDVECFLGTLNVFLSPKQVHLLTEFASGFSAPGLFCLSGQINLWRTVLLVKVQAYLVKNKKIKNVFFKKMRKDKCFFF